MVFQATPADRQPPNKAAPGNRGIPPASLRRWSIPLKVGLAIALLSSLASCAFPESVQRINVDYNNTIEGITNELTLLNIIRAKEGMPLHYTSVQRLSGSLTLRTSAGINAQLRSDAPTNTTQATSSVAPGGTTLTNVATRQVLSGGNVFTPSLGAEVNTGPTFDVNILDSQVFYQGILAAVPFSTINNFIMQGYEDDFLFSLFAERIEFRLKTDTSTPKFKGKKGLLLRTMKNHGGSKTDPDFNALLDCYFVAGDSKRDGTTLAPMSRVATSSMTLRDLAQLDGVKLDLKEPLTNDLANDSNVLVVRPPEKKTLVGLREDPSCASRTDPNGTLVTSPHQRPDGTIIYLPTVPPPEPPYVGAGQIMVMAADGKSGTIVDADLSVVFRSTEAVIQFIGDCLNAAPTDNGRKLCQAAKVPLFALREGSSDRALVSSTFRDRRYYIADDDYRRRTMQVVGIIERLINLQKSSTDRPVTVPVQIIP